MFFSADFFWGGSPEQGRNIGRRREMIFDQKEGSYGVQSAPIRSPIRWPGAKTDRFRGLLLRKNRAKEPINPCRNPEVFAKLLGSNDP